MSIIHAIGRRKTAVARVFLKEGSGHISINGRDLKTFFPTGILQSKVLQPMKLTGTQEAYDLKVSVKGGGVTGQAEAIRHAISRALCTINVEYRPVLKSEGLLTRDPRMVERKKYGRKKARKRFQFSKR